LWQTLDEMTSMKILSRIEGDSERTKKVLEELKVLVEEEINKSIPEPEDGKEKLKSISDLKIKEMLEKLSSGYTSYWA
ncbi:MAG: restriction endonuclease, partial [Bacteroidales bacterium]|nr:restriction endonuclease [Bacteroidales bacterium]